MRTKSILITIGALAVALSIVAGISWLTRMKSEPTIAAPAGAADPPGVFASERLTDCWAVELPPAGEEINTVLDSYSRRLQISFMDARLGEDRVFYISYEDPACQERPELKSIIDGALAVHSQTIASTCRSMAEIVRRGEPVVTSPGRPAERINLEAAKRYLERWCR